MSSMSSPSETAGPSPNAAAPSVQARPAELPLLIGNGDENVSDIFSENGLFSTRRPKHAMAGLSSGLKNVGKGLATGVAALVAMPIHGAKSDGLKGFSKGLVLGAASGVALAVTGAATGVIQVSRGIYNTPGAIKGGLSDQVWNSDTRQWIHYSLQEEAARVLSQDANTAETNSNRTVVDEALYEELGVHSNATQQEIKKAYRMKAIQLHPDKNPNDEKASEKFQQLGAAYQILSDEQLRASYDQFGKSGIDERNLFDSSQLFEMVFGSQRFEAFVGELRLMQIQSALSKVDPDGTDEEKQDALDRAMELANSHSKVRQNRREVQCAVNLVEKLDQLAVDSTDDNAAFKISIEAEAKELSSTAFGGTLIGVLGYVYEEQALSYLGFRHNISAGIGITNVKKSAHVLANKYRVLTSVMKAYKVAKHAQKEDEKRSQLQETPESDPTSSMPAGGVDAILETIWNISVIDVESTLRNVCQKIFTDSSVSSDVRQQRAKALLLIAAAFQRVSQSRSAGLGEFKAKFSDLPQEEL